MQYLTFLEFSKFSGKYHFQSKVYPMFQILAFVA